MNILGVIMYLTAYNIKRALAKRHKDDVFATEVKNGPTWRFSAAQEGHLQIDALAMKKSWSKPHFAGYEIKISRSDFTGDTKWLNYKDFTHTLSLVCPTGLVQKDEIAEIDNTVGLIYYNSEKNSLCTVKKPLYRTIELPASMLYYFLMNKVKGNTYTANDKADFFRAWLADKKSNKELGLLVRSKLIDQIGRLERENNILQSCVVNELEREAYRHMLLQLNLRRSDINNASSRFEVYRLINKQLEQVGSFTQKAVKKDIEDTISSLSKLLEAMETEAGL